MASGFFLGGMAEGAKTADDLLLRSQTLDDARSKAASDAITSELGKLTDAAVDITNKAREAGATPDKIAALVAPLRGNIDRLARVGGRDATSIFNRLDGLAGVPRSESSDTPDPTTEIGKLRQDLKNGFITQPEFDARVRNITREIGEPNIIENIRRKIAVGEPLSDGEKTVYDDALKADPIARLIAGAIGGKAPVPSASPPARPDPLKLR